ncbi:uracil/xanthine transporter [Paenibacillus illinoisensis]|uniref:uracil/xanthine transporter n=1 Tax=Paenibacillus illinoisensis TaxID=59845 RepID=UPI003A4E2C71
MNRHQEHFITKYISQTSSLVLAGIQWFFFLFTNTVVVPLSIGHNFHMSPDAIAASMQHAFLLTGAVCILQAVFGHRYAVMDGPSGLWWGLTLSLTVSASSAGMSLERIGGGLAAGFLLAGLTMAVLGRLGAAHLLQKLFTPMVKSAMLFLMTIQLTMNFFKGMIGYTEFGTFNLPVAALSVAIAFLVALIQLKGRGKLGNYAILIGIVTGWIAYSFVFPGQHAGLTGNSGGSLFTLFPWGVPTWEPGIVVTAFFVGLVNMTNSITTLSTVEKIYETQTTDQQYKRSYVLTGLFSMLSACVGVLPFGLFASSIGFLESTRILRRAAFVIGAAMLCILGLTPSVTAFFAQIPPSVGSAVLFVAYLQMFGTALRTIEGTAFNSKTIYRVALPVLTGVAVMNIPAEAFQALPIYLIPIISNGLVIGVMVSLILEKSVNWSKMENASTASKTVTSP